MLMPSYGALSATPQPVSPEAMESQAHEEAMRHQNDDHHLRSCKEVVGYHIQADDGDIGHLQGMLVDEETWAIRYLIVNTSNWWVGHQVLISPRWIRDVNWSESSISVNMTRQEIKDAPPYNTAEQLNRDQEFGIFKHYGRTGYWADGVEREKAK